MKCGKKSVTLAFFKAYSSLDRTHPSKALIAAPGCFNVDGLYAAFSLFDPLSFGVCP